VRHDHRPRARRGARRRRQHLWDARDGPLAQEGVYPPIREYDVVTLAKDLSAPLVYGTVPAAALQLLP